MPKASLEINTKPLCRVLKAMVVTLTIFTTAACTSVVIRPVSEANRDQSGIFDGQWLATVVRTPPKQTSLTGTFTCGDLTGAKYPLIVSDGAISLTKNDKVSYINSHGVFRMEIPMSVIFKTEGPIQPDDKGALIISGSLKKGTGTLLPSSNAMSGTGCMSKMKFEKA